MLCEPILCQFLVKDVGRLTNALEDDAIKGTVALGTEDEIANIVIGLDAERPKENPQRNICLDARHRRLQKMNLLILGVINHFYRVILRYLIVIRTDTLNFNDFNILTEITIITENERAILTHALLADDNTLTTLYNEVATEIIEALAELRRIDVLLVM